MAADDGRGAAGLLADTGRRGGMLSRARLLLGRDNMICGQSALVKVMYTAGLARLEPQRRLRMSAASKVFVRMGDGV